MKKIKYGGDYYTIHEVDRLPLIGEEVEGNFKLVKWLETGIYDCDVYPVQNCYDDNRMITIGIIEDEEDQIRYAFSVRCETAKAKELPKVGDIYDRDYVVAEINQDDIDFTEEECKDDEKAYIEVFVKNKDGVYEKGVQFEVDNPYYEE